MKGKIKNILKETLKHIIVFIGMALVFCLFLIITSIIPRDLLTQKVRESSEILNVQTNTYNVLILDKNYMMNYDNFSDALMVNTAYSIDSKRPFYSAMIARKNYIDGVTKVIYPDEAGELKSASKYECLDQVGELNDTVNNDIEESFEYARYWHGYLCILRPLFLILNVTQIRYLFLTLFIVTAVLLLYKLYKEFDLGTSLVFLLGLWICDYFWIYNSLHSSFVFAIAMIASLILLYKEVYNNTIFFMLIGGLTSFLDLLSVPIITLGMPLLVYVLVYNKAKVPFKQLFWDIIKCSICWAIGYFGIFFAKWLIVDLIYNKNLIKISIQQYFFRSSTLGELKIPAYYVIIRNIRASKPSFIISIIIVVAIIIFKVLVKVIKDKSFKNIHINITEVILYLMIASIGICWYSILKEHACKHTFFTHRIYWFICTGSLLSIYNLFKIEKEDVKRIGE